VKGYGIVDLRRDAALAKIEAQLLSVRHTNDELVIHVETTVTDPGNDDRVAQPVVGEQRAVTVGIALARSGPLGQMFQLDPQNARLQGVQAAIHP